ncbi:PLP-dependent lyase/thiolase [Candidatus Kaiserbacteria bacterium]|nr:PLP-dependent lyase/thiolase [Candidatus Kaiserbacteria bacterium]
MNHSLPIRKIDISFLPGPYSNFFTTRRVHLYAIMGFDDRPDPDLNDPSGNIKRIAAEGIVKGRRSREGFTGITHAVDSTSGNFGPALAAELARNPDTAHIKTICVVSKTLPQGKLARLTACGAEIVPAENQLAAMDVAESYQFRPGYWYTSQYDNPDNPAAFLPYGENLAAELPNLGVFSAGIGTGGTFIGFVEGFRSRRDTPAWQLHAIAATVAKGHSISGIRTLEALQRVKNPWQASANRIERVDLPTALEASRALQAAGIPGGPSSGAALAALYQGLRSRSTAELKVMQNGNDNIVAAFICADRWEVYRDLYLYEPQK